MSDQTEQDITRVSRIANQLLGDLSRVPGVTLPAESEKQVLQLLLDAFDEVGLMAMEVKRRYEASCPLADCILDYPHLHPNLLQTNG